MRKGLLKIILHNPLKVSTVILLATLIALVFIQVVSRYVFNYPIGWGGELSRLFFIWVSLFAAIAAFKGEEHFKCTYFIDKLSPINKKIVLLFNNLLIGLAIGVLIWYGIGASKLAGMQDFVTLGFTVFWQYLALPLCSALMFYYCVKRLYKITREIEDYLKMRNKKG